MIKSIIQVLVIFAIIAAVFNLASNSFALGSPRSKLVSESYYRACVRSNSIDAQRILEYERVGAVVFVGERGDEVRHRLKQIAARTQE